MSSVLRRLGRILAADLDDRVADDLPRTQAELEALIRVAARHDVLPALARIWAGGGLGAVPVDDDIAMLLREVRRGARARHTALRRQLVEVVGALNAVGIEPVLLKGAARLVDGLYPNPEDRLMADLDLLVPADRSAEARAALIARGWGEVDHGIEPLPDHHHAPALVRSGAPGAVEIHTDLVRATLRPLLAPEPLMARASLVRVGDRIARLPHPDDQIIHLLAHRLIQHQGTWLFAVPLRDIVEGRLLQHRRGVQLAGAVAGGVAAARLGSSARRWTVLEKTLLDGAPLRSGSALTRLWVSLVLAADDRAAALRPVRAAVGLGCALVGHLEHPPWRRHLFRKLTSSAYWRRKLGVGGRAGLPQG